MDIFRQKGFSLMEMMVVLLITAIVAAATAPMVTKKMMRGSGSGDSPWVFTGERDNLAYNMRGSDNATVVIGRAALPHAFEDKTRLFIDSGDDASHIAFGNGDIEPLQLTVDPANGRIGFSNEPIKNKTVSFGAEQSLRNSYERSIIIGNSINKYVWHWGNNGYYDNPNANGYPSYSASKNEGNVIIGDAAYMEPNSRAGIVIGAQAASNLCSVVVGTYASLPGEASSSVLVGASTEGHDWGATAIGYHADAELSGTALGYYARAGKNGIAVGSGHLENVENSSIRGANASGERSIAVGVTSKASGTDSIAIGTYANSTHDNAIAIGARAETTASHQIVLGTANDTVYIPGNLVVGHDVYLGADYSSFGIPNFRVFMRRNDGVLTQLTEPNGDSDNTVRADPTSASVPYSDRRLKNVGEKYTAGLEELKNLDLFHYTFKKDENKTPHVGVMAQDLQKVFPDAVTEGGDGYLRIRMEDMFYALINAVKELDNKIAEIINNIYDLNTRLDNQQKVIEKQQATIEELKNIIEKQNKDLSERVE